MAIDVWAQVPGRAMAGQPWLATLARWSGKDGFSFETTASATLAAMDEGGVEIALLAGWRGPQGPLITNDEVERMVESAPGRFRGVACADLERPMESVREIRRLVAGKKFVAARVVPWLWELPPNDRRYYPIYAACVDLGIPFCTQIGHTGPLRRSETGRMIPYLEDVMLDFPELIVVGGHVGFPWIDELVTMTVKFPNFYVDTSAYALSRLPSDFISWMKGLGKRRVMFGTNWPMLSPRHCLSGLPDLGLSPEAQDLFLHGNARRVFGL